MFGVPKLMIYAAIAVIVLGAIGAIYHRIDRAAYIRGQDELQQAVEKRNAAAAKGAQEARNALDRCYDTGGTWDQSTGLCIAKR